MGWSTHHPLGLIHHSPDLCYPGYTLLSTNYGDETRLLDMEGRVCHRWHVEAGVGYGFLLPSGNLLLRSRPPQDAGVGRIGGSSASIQELDWDGNLVWEYRDPMVHHDFKRLPNGNTLVLLFEPMPAELTARVQGGFATDRDPQQMLGELVREVAPDGTAVSEWHCWEHLSVEEDIICPLEGRREWTHGNSLSVTPNGDLLVSFRQTSTIGIVDRATGDFRWKWGPGVIDHQHHPTYLDNGHVLLFDNGPHRRGVSYSRVIEVDPATNEIAWEYHGEPRISFYSYNISSAERLPNGNTLICEGARGRIFEVTSGGTIVWEYLNPVAVEQLDRAALGTEAGTIVAGEGRPATERSTAVFRAHRYGPDHPGLQGRDLTPGNPD
jgi:hypothetical protein